MKIITLLNEKGGTGKTTLATHIAAGLAAKGQTVLLVDADPQGHATISLGHAKEPCLYDLLVRGASFQAMTRPVDSSRYALPGQTGGGLYLLPSNIETRNISGAVGDDLWLFQERFIGLAGQFDAVVIDTSPTPSLLHGLIYLATDYLLYPTELESLSLDGLSESIRHKSKANQARQSRELGDLHVLGVQPTMYRKTDAQDYNLQELLKAFKQMVMPTLPQRTAWQEASVARRTVWAYRPNSKAAQEAWALVERVAKGVGL